MNIKKVYKAEEDYHKAVIEALDDNDMNFLKEIYKKYMIDGTYYVREFSEDDAIQIGGSNSENILVNLIEHGIIYNNHGICSIKHPYIVEIKNRIYV